MHCQTAIAPPTPPILAINAAGEITWPSDSVGFTLQFTSIPCSTAVPKVHQGQANRVLKITSQAVKPHPAPFEQVNLDVVFINPMGKQKTVPVFWAGGDV